MSEARYFEQFRGDETMDSGDAEWKYGSIWDAEDWVDEDYYGDDFDDDEPDNYEDEWPDSYELKWTKDGATARLVVETWRVVVAVTDTELISQMAGSVTTSIDTFAERYHSILLEEKARVEANEVPRDIFPLLDNEDERWWRLDCLYDDVLPRPPWRPLAIPF